MNKKLICECGSTTFTRIFGLMDAKIVVYVPTTPVPPEEIENVNLYCTNCINEYHNVEIIDYKCVEDFRVK